MRLAWFENPRVSGLVAGHANIIVKIWGQAGRIDNLCVRTGITFSWLGAGLLHRLHMGCAGAMAVFAADSQFGEGRTFELSDASRHRVGPTAVAKDASRRDRPVEAQICE